MESLQHREKEKIVREHTLLKLTIFPEDKNRFEQRTVLEISLHWRHLNESNNNDRDARYRSVNTSSV